MTNARTVEDCDERYYGIAKELSNTNQLIKIIVWLVSFCFPMILAWVVYIYSSLNGIQMALKQHELETMAEVVTLKEQVLTLNKIINK